MECYDRLRVRSKETPLGFPSYYIVADVIMVHVASRIGPPRSSSQAFLVGRVTQKPDIFPDKRGGAFFSFFIASVSPIRPFTSSSRPSSLPSCRPSFRRPPSPSSPSPSSSSPSPCPRPPQARDPRVE